MIALNGVLHLKDWISKYKPNYGSFISEDYCAIDDAPLIIMDIGLSSGLNEVFIGLSGCFEDELFVGNKIANNWVQEEFIHDKSLVKDIDNHETEFIALIKEYLILYRAISKSSLVMKPAGNVTKKTFGDERAYISIPELIAWAIKKGISLNRELIQLYKTEPEQSKSDLSEKERNSLLKIIYGMAIEKYDYSPSNNSRSTVTGNNSGSIHYDLSLHGINVDVATIRKYLKEAAEKNKS